MRRFFDMVLILSSLKRVCRAVCLLIPVICICTFTMCSMHDFYLPEYGGGYWHTDDEGSQGAGDRYTDYGENVFINTASNPVSTFSVDADGASYATMRAYFNLGQTPPAASVRLEEYLNYFTFDYPEPENGENLSMSYETAVCPWNTEHYLLRLGIKGKTIEKDQLPPSNYVFMVDVSGSMNSNDRLELLKQGYIRLVVDALKEDDKVSIVTYSGAVSVPISSASGSQKEEIKQAINGLRAYGSTNGGDAIYKAYNLAMENFVEGGNNRIILGTDGDFNVGITNTKDLIKLVEEYLDKGIYLTVLGVGMGNLNESMMEQLANKGNGNYEYVDCIDQIDKIFVNESNKFYTVAKDSKLQVTFNPDKVLQYRLLGYENRLMSGEDFEDDRKDAGEVGAGQTITALYELVPVGAPAVSPAVAAADLPVSGAVTDLGEDWARWELKYKKPSDEVSRSLSMNMTCSGAPEITSASTDLQFTASLAALGMILKQSSFKGNADQNMVRSLAEGGIGSFDPYGYRAAHLQMLGKWR